jgi:hypothetical protein
MATVFDRVFKRDEDGRLTLGWGRPTEKAIDLEALSSEWVPFRDYLMEGGVAFEIILGENLDGFTRFCFRSNDDFRGMYVGAAIRAYLKEAGFTVSTETQNA